jgi:uncharacterized protein (TIGR00251 family)
VSDDAPLDLREAGGGVTLRVRVQPRASREGIGEVREGALVVRLTAPPVEGAANRALTKLLAKTLGVAPSAIDIVHGDRGRDKVVRVSGITARDTRERVAR